MNQKFVVVFIELATGVRLDGRRTASPFRHGNCQIGLPFFANGVSQMQYRTQPDPGEQDPTRLRSHVLVLLDELQTVNPRRGILQLGNEEKDAAALRSLISQLNEALAEAYIEESGHKYHTYDCAINQAPAFRPGPCTCGGGRQPK